MNTIRLDTPPSASMAPVPTAAALPEQGRARRFYSAVRSGQLPLSDLPRASYVAAESYATSTYSAVTRKAAALTRLPKFVVLDAAMQDEADVVAQPTTSEQAQAQAPTTATATATARATTNTNTAPTAQATTPRHEAPHDVPTTVTAGTPTRLARIRTQLRAGIDALVTWFRVTLPRATRVAFATGKTKTNVALSHVAAAVRGATRYAAGKLTQAKANALASRDHVQAAWTRNSAAPTK